jgi:hypothetical protein
MSGRGRRQQQQQPQEEGEILTNTQPMDEEPPSDTGATEKKENTTKAWETFLSCNISPKTTTFFVKEHTQLTHA